MNTQKMLAGEPDWQNGPYDGSSRWLRPLAIDGTTIGMNLCVDSYPRASFTEFHIMLIYETCISRLDFSEIDRHHNRPIKRITTPPGIKLGWLYGPHFHRWIDNRMLADAKNGLKALPFAISLETGTRSFESVFRYFCAECKVLVAANEMPLLPSRDTIL